MAKARFLGLLSAVALFHVAQAQDFRVSGTVFDFGDGSILPGAYVQLINVGDTTKRRTTEADLEGRFAFDSVEPGDLVIRSGYVGYAELELPLKITADVPDIQLRLKSSITELRTVEKVATQARAEQRGDTTIFNASAYKVDPNASAADLVNKMPGITSVNGTIKAQGEQVVRVLVDGTEFFGNEAAIALKNLPAKVIDKVQIFDKQSDQAAFTGFDDGNREKTLNIVTKKGMDHGVFGDAKIGYGTDDRYDASLSLNWMKGPRRAGLMGQRDNVSRYFAANDPGGIATTDLIGFDYNDQIGGTKLSGTWFFNEARSNTNTISERTTYLSDSTAQVTNSAKDGTTENSDHIISFRVETEFDSSNSLVLTPEFGFQWNTLANAQLSRVRNADSLQLSTTDNANTANGNGASFSNSLLFRHRFAKRGRTISANLTTSLSGRHSTGTLLANNSFPTDTTTIATLIDQRSTDESSSQHHGLQLNYTEPVSEHGQLQFALSPSIQSSHAEKLTNDIDPDTGDEGLNALLSNKADNTIRTLRGGVSYGYDGAQLSFTIGLDGQGRDMHSVQDYPFEFTVDRSYTNLLPNAGLSRNWGNTTRLRINYQTSVNTPSMAQLQAVVDNSDPLNLTTGNPGLDQSHQHSLSFRFNTLDSTRTRSFFALLDLQVQPDRISSVTFLPATDSTLANGTGLPAGSQLTLPKNLDGYVSARLFADHDLPIPLLKSNLGLNGGCYVERLPGEVNHAKSLTWNSNWQLGAALRSNIGPSVDFRVGYTANLRTARCDLRSSLNNSYYQGELTAVLTLNGWKGWLLENEVDHQQNSGLGEAYDRDILIWNASIGHKFLKDEALEFRASVNDILDNNVSVMRNVGDTYIQTTATNLLQRYVIFSLRYDLSAFKSAAEAPASEGAPPSP